MGEDKQEDVGELIARAWSLVELAEGRLRDESLDENDKIRWAGVLATVIGTLNKLMWKAGVGRLDKESVAKLLEKVPKKYREVVFSRVKVRKKMMKDER
jgi:uncharacterized membrane protein